MGGLRGSAGLVARLREAAVESPAGEDAVSIHVYGTGIVARPGRGYDSDTGAAAPFRPPSAEAAGR